MSLWKFFRNFLFPGAAFLISITAGKVLSAEGGYDFKITVLKYRGGGDWYEGRVGIPNLMHFLRTNTGIRPKLTPEICEPDDSSLSFHKFLYLTGHGNIDFSPGDVRSLRDYLTSGGFLYADDDFGMDLSFRREMKKVFPESEWVVLPNEHPVFNIYFNFPRGLPKIHEHNGLAPQALGLFHKGRLVVLYTVESNIGDGWAPFEVHKDPDHLRLEALRFGVNLILYSMTR